MKELGREVAGSVQTLALTMTAAPSQWPLVTVRAARSPDRFGGGSFGFLPALTVLAGGVAACDRFQRLVIFISSSKVRTETDGRELDECVSRAIKARTRISGTRVFCVFTAFILVKAAASRGQEAAAGCQGG